MSWTEEFYQMMLEFAAKHGVTPHDMCNYLTSIIIVHFSEGPGDEEDIREYLRKFYRMWKEEKDHLKK
jgi:hypothetical protein